MTGCEITLSPYFKLEKYLKKKLKKNTLLYHKSFEKSDSLFATCIVVDKWSNTVNAKSIFPVLRIRSSGGKILVEIFSTHT
jgi:hypothetical protein